jgi:hypothetical protein
MSACAANEHLQAVRSQGVMLWMDLELAPRRQVTRGNDLSCEYRVRTNRPMGYRSFRESGLVPVFKLVKHEKECSGHEGGQDLPRS